MINQELAEIFQHMAEILEYFGDPGDHFRIRAYQNASLVIKDMPDSLEQMVKEKRLTDVPGIGKGIAQKIEEYIKRGKIKEYEMLKKATPKGLFELLEIPFLGPRKVRVLNKELGIANIKDLKRAIEKGAVQKLPGFGKRSAEKIMEGINMKTASKGRVLFGEIYPLVQEIVASLKKCRYISKVVPAGSFRRAEETIGDIDILATGKNQKAIMEYFKKQDFVKKVLAAGNTKTSILTHEGVQADIRLVRPAQFGSALQYFTGSKLHNIHLRTIAKNRGYKISEYGFFKGNKLVASRTEEECYASLGMQYIPPEMRTDTGEIEAAYKNQIPKLIELEDIRGDLHAHSVWSDGGNSIKEMALAAHRRGYEYIAITDHSPSLRVASGLDLGRLKEKKREIEKLNEELPIKILFGTEVDILADGTLDYPNEVLAMFDIVVAAIHSRMNQDNTERLIKAMENPHAHIIAHPSGRWLGKRKPYPLNYPRIFRCSRDTGTILEISSQYVRFDLQDVYIREAKKYSCMFAINTDAHSTASLELMELGVKWARRGWATKKDVVNTLPWSQLKRILK